MLAAAKVHDEDTANVGAAAHTSSLAIVVLPDKNSDTLANRCTNRKLRRGPFSPRDQVAYTIPFLRRWDLNRRVGGMKLGSTYTIPPHRHEKVIHATVLVIASFSV